MGVVKDSLPPVPEDKEIRAKNRARNEEQKKAKDDKKAKAARKAQRREISAKNHREAEKAGVAPPPSPETSVSEIEGGGGSTDWLDELAEEDDVIPPAGGGIEAPADSRARGGSEAPRGPKCRGTDRPSPTSLWMMRIAPLMRVRPRWDLKKGRGRRRPDPRRFLIW
jgi:hypothetical protein